MIHGGHGTTPASMRRRARRVAVAALLGALGVAAHAQSVTYNGMLGDRALLVIDGHARTVAIGASVQGVKLVRLDGDRAQIEVGGKTTSLRIGGSMVGSGGAGGSGSEIVLPAGPGGHFMGQAMINGHSVPFMVDTGASTVSLGRDQAQQLGLDLSNGTNVRAMTANGLTVARTFTLTSLRIGDVTVSDVPAVVMSQPMPFMLLGNSFLSRFRMRTDSDTLVLDKK